MAFEHSGPARDPWNGSCREEFNDPNWKPLSLVVRSDRISEFIWMGRIRGDDWSIELYKHRSSRRYLNVDLAGITYCYIESRYVPISTTAALRRVFRDTSS